MKALDFFFKQITAQQAEAKRLRIENFIDDYQLKYYTMYYSAYSNIIYCCDKSSYSINYLDFDNYEIGEQRTWVSVERYLKDEYSNWVINVFPKETDIIINDNSIKPFVSKVNEYVSDINNLEEPLASILKDLIEDYESLLIKYYPKEFNLKMFVLHEDLPYKRQFYFPENSIKDLKAVFNFDGANNPISKTITKDEWINFFIKNAIPKNKIELNYSTKVVSLLLKRLIQKYSGEYTEKAILEDIEKSNLFRTKKGDGGGKNLSASNIRNKAFIFPKSELEADKKLVARIFVCVK